MAATKKEVEDEPLLKKGEGTQNSREVGTYVNVSETRGEKRAKGG